MKKMFLKSLAISSLLFTSQVFASTCIESGQGNGGSYPKGSEYLLAGVTKTFYHDGDYRYDNKIGSFFTSEGYAGDDEYNYQDFKWRAKKPITFSSLYRGPQWVLIYDPVAGVPWCNDIYVQNRPSISKISLNQSTKQATVSYSVDTYSKYVREGKPRTITFNWREDTYGTTGVGASVSTTSLSGNKTATLSFPGGGIYSIDATISDGTYSASVHVGWISIAGSAEPPCPTCQPL